MKKLALLFAAVLAATPALAGNCLIREQTPLGPISPKHQLVDAAGTAFTYGTNVVICMRHPSGAIVTHEEALAAARAYIRDWKPDCDFVSAEHWDTGAGGREWRVYFKCRTPVVPPIQFENHP
jgi:hypothetical protein